ncbi:MAG: phosphatidylinositol-specific phospholipase C/glycerophosphodiester phosphodiesterase family protein [Chitinophagaceae bacterium]|nr:phosphatidylinositol-specific phospholipase C/glycerophosphodiester phosphodiesterase family protein [Chitinophagaceae bacterium]
MRKFSFIYLLLFFQNIAFSQPSVYTTANAHSHNDYEKPQPFTAAYQQQFGSIEADIFLKDDELYVAHTDDQLAQQRTLDSFYLKPLAALIKRNKGFAYADKKRQLQLMIDIKTEAVSTLNKLIAQIKKYPSLIACPTLKIVISGNRPAPAAFSTVPAFIHFDAQFTVDYPEAALKKVEMYSDNFKNYSQWKGQGMIAEKDSLAIASAIQKAHAVHKKVRFWNAPDTPEAWDFFMSVGVDYINTDHIAEMAAYLKNARKRVSDH